MRTGRLPDGIEYPIRDRTSVSEMRAKRRQYSKVERHLNKLLDQDQQTASLKLSKDELHLVRDSLRDAKRMYELESELADLRAELDALRSLAFHNRDKPRQVLQALGVTAGRRGPRYHTRLIVAEYLHLSGQDRQPGQRYRLMRPVRRNREYVYPEPPLPLRDALALVAEEHGFRSRLHCRRHIRDARRKLKSDSSSHFPKDFKLPPERDC